MEVEKTSREERYRLFRAMKRVEATKGYYMHVATYIFMNIFILTAWAVDSFLPESFYKTSVFIIAVFGGVGVLVNTVVHFGHRTPWGRKWEERTLRKFMERDRRSNNNTNPK